MKEPILVLPITPRLVGGLWLLFDTIGKEVADESYVTKEAADHAAVLFNTKATFDRRRAIEGARDEPIGRHDRNGQSG